jgi:hypothetical protein
MAATNVQAFSGDVEISSNLAVNTDDLFVDTVNSRVGIGTTNPLSALEVFSTAGTQLNLRSDSRYSTIFAVDDTGSSFFGNDGGAIRFTTGGDTSGNGASEKMRILADGNVGIGTASPRQKLDLGNLGGGSIRLGRDHDGDNTSTNRIGRTGVGDDIWYSSVNFIDEDTNDDAISFVTHQSGVGQLERMRISGNGNVGIGKADPDYPLDVDGAIRYSGTTYNHGILGGNAHPVKDQIINSGTLSAGNWYRIAKNGSALDGEVGGSRCMARFTLTDVQTSEHSTRVFYAGSTFGREPFFHLVANTSYDPPGVIEKVRLVDSELADSEGFAIDIYIHATVGANAVQVVMDDNIQTSGFQLVNFEANPVTTGMAVDEYDLTSLIWAVSPSDTGADAGIFLQQNGRVGIGTTNPFGPLHVYGDAGETNAPLRIQSADRYCGLIMQDSVGGVQLQNDQGVLRIITEYAADLTLGVEVARISEHELWLKGARNSRIYIEDTGTDDGTYYQGLYIGSPVSDTDAGLRMIVSHDANTTGNRRNIIGFTNRSLEFNTFADNDTTSGFGSTQVYFSTSGQIVGNHNGQLPLSLGMTGSRLRFYASSFGFYNAGNSHTFPFNLIGGNGGGATLLFITDNHSGGNATRANLIFIRKYHGGTWAKSSSTFVVLSALNGSYDGLNTFSVSNNQLVMTRINTNSNGNYQAFMLDIE